MQKNFVFLQSQIIFVIILLYFTMLILLNIYELLINIIHISARASDANKQKIKYYVHNYLHGMRQDNRTYIEVQQSTNILH